MDGFIKYEPPHLRKKNRRKNKKNINTEKKVDTNNIQDFPSLSKDDDIIINKTPVNESPEWNYTIEEKEKHENKNEYFYIGDLKFKQDDTIDEGFIVLCKNKNNNRGNYKHVDIKPYDHDNENYYKLINMFEIHPDNNMYMVPRYCSSIYNDNYDEDYYESCSNNNYYYYYDEYYDEENEVINEENNNYESDDSYDY